MLSPSVARKHPFVAGPRRSTCMGALDRLGVRSVQPESLSPAVALVLAWTSVIVTYTWENGPLGAWHVAGSLTITLTWAMPDPVEVVVVVLLQATTIRVRTVSETK